MFGKHHHYVPILKWKQGEQHALGELSPPARSRITPFIEFVDVPLDPATGKAKKTVTAHVAAGIAAITKQWGSAAPFFLDARACGGSTIAFGSAKAVGLQAIPVVDLAATSAVVSAATGTSANGICVRVTPSELAQGNSVTSKISALMKAHSLSYAATDVVLDLGSIVGASSFVASAAALSALQLLPNLSSWRTVTMASTAFPENLSGVKSGTSALIPRLDWTTWSALYATRKTLQRLPSFGDYGIQNPVLADGYDPRFMPMSAAIRYTTSAAWYVIRGVSSKKVGLATQFPGLAKQLMASAHYAGHQHCRGSLDVQSCAANKPGFGSPGVWRRIGTTHHIEVVTGQLTGLAYP